MTHSFTHCTRRRARLSTLAPFGALICTLAHTGCASKSEPAGTTQTGTVPGSRADKDAGGSRGSDAATSDPGLLVVVTERESPDVNFQYLHVLEDWPEDGKLDYSRAFELPEFVSVRADGNAVFVYQPLDTTVRKLILNPDGEVAFEDTISFQQYGVTGDSAENIWVAPDTAFLVDETSGQLIRWNPTRMEIQGATEIDPSSLERAAFPVQLQQGVAVGDRAFTAVNWRDWSTFEYLDTAALGYFDATAAEPRLEIIEDDRCAPSVALSPFDGEDGYVYLVSDAALGFDALANPKPTTKPLCVLRMNPKDNQFDPDFFVDLKAATGSPAFYTAHPMQGNRLLVNVWAQDVDVADVATKDSDWYWSSPPYFEYRIVDLARGSSIPVPDLPRAAVQFSVTLRVDGDNFVQLYREDGGSDLHRVDPDATVTSVLHNGPGTDVQYLGRVAR